MYDNSAASNSSQPSAESPKFVERWDDRQVRLLISCYSKFKHLFGKGKTTKKEVFAKIAVEFNSISDQKVTAVQCSGKWSKLEQKQKEVEDNNKQTGKARKSWKFHDDMTECMGSSPKINPGFTFDTSSSGSSGASQCDNDDQSPDPQMSHVMRMAQVEKKKQRCQQGKERAIHLQQKCCNSFIPTVRAGKKQKQRNWLYLNPCKMKKRSFIHNFLMCLKRNKN